MTEKHIALAKQAGFKNDCDGVWCNADQLKKFADLIRADEREACAKLCESHVSYPSRLHFAAAIRARSDK